MRAGIPVTILASILAWHSIALSQQIVIDQPTCESLLLHAKHKAHMSLDSDIEIKAALFDLRKQILTLLGRMPDDPASFKELMQALSLRVQAPKTSMEQQEERANEKSE